MRPAELLSVPATRPSSSTPFVVLAWLSQRRHIKCFGGRVRGKNKYSFPIGFMIKDKADAGSHLLSANALLLCSGIVLSIGRLYPQITTQKRIDMHADVLRRHEFRDEECMIKYAFLSYSLGQGD
jgi:hypothetical protein